MLTQLVSVFVLLLALLKPVVVDAGSCSSLLNKKASWNTGWTGRITLPVNKAGNSWKVKFIFTTPVTSFEQWTGRATKHSSTRFTVSLNTWVSSGQALSFDFLYRYRESGNPPRVKLILLNGVNMCSGTSPVVTTPNPPVAGTTAPQNPYTGSGCTSGESPYNYDEVLHKSLLFYEAQRSGRLPASQRVTWRKNSATDDAKDGGTKVDLEGGYYDAGDFVKFGFPMAYTTTVLAWGAIEYGAAYEAAGEMSYMKEAVKWATDYFIKAHPKPNILYGQVGDGNADHSFWGRPEDMTMARPAFKITPSNPGSDLAGETAAAMAAASILFKDSHSSYAKACLQHAKDLYNFANQYRKKYSDSIPNASKFYNSWSGFDDELGWAAAWLFRATGNRKYLADAKSHYSRKGGNVGEFSWDEKTPGVQVLLAEYADASDRANYKRDLKTFCDKIIHQTQRTPKKLVFISKWGPLRYAANSAFICLRAADLGINPSKYREFGKQQIHYMLGDAGRSYVVGFGKNPPKRPHHRSSSCPSAPQACSWDTYNSPAPNPHELTGALVGGPDANDNYQDKRDDYISNEVATDYNAGFQSAVAALRALSNC